MRSEAQFAAERDLIQLSGGSGNPDCSFWTSERDPIGVVSRIEECSRVRDSARERSTRNYQECARPCPAEHPADEHIGGGHRLGDHAVRRVRVQFFEPPAHDPNILKPQAADRVPLEVMTALSRFYQDEGRLWAQDRERQPGEAGPRAQVYQASHCRQDGV